MNNTKVILSSIKLTPPSYGYGSGRVIDTATIDNTQSELLLYGPGKVWFQAEEITPIFEIGDVKEAQIDISLSPVNAELSVNINVQLPMSEQKKDEMYRWETK